MRRRHVVETLLVPRDEDQPHVRMSVTRRKICIDRGVLLGVLRAAGDEDWGVRCDLEIRTKLFGSGIRSVCRHAVEFDRAGDMQSLRRMPSEASRSA